MNLNAALLSGSIIDLDGTLFVQLALFTVLFFILKSLVFKPMVKLFEAREEAIEGAREDAKRMEKEAAEKADTFEEEMREVRLKAQAERDKLRVEGARLERAVLDKVREETRQTMAQAEKNLTQEATRVRKEIDATIPKLANEMAGRLLGRELN
ncbi:MAG: ATP synthase F0 subunit B [Myxococcota bacterium]